MSGGTVQEAQMRFLSSCFRQGIFSQPLEEHGERSSFCGIGKRLAKDVPLEMPPSGKTLPTWAAENLEMGIDINSVHNIANAWASRERDAANSGKRVNQKGWVSKEQMRKDAAQKTIVLLVAIFAVRLLSKILVSFGKWSLKTFGPTWGMVVNIAGIVLLIISPVCMMKLAEANREAADAKAAEQERIRIEKYTKQKNAEIDAYRSVVRGNVNSLAERCNAEGMPFDEVVKVFEENSKIIWKSGMTDDFVRNEMDRAFQSCVEAIDKYHTEKIWKVEDYINNLVADLNSKTTPDAYYHIAQFRDKMGDKDRGRHHVLNYKISYERIKKQIDAEYQICINEIRSKNGFKDGVDVPLINNPEPNDDSAADDMQSGDEKAQKRQGEVPAVDAVPDVTKTDAANSHKEIAQKNDHVDGVQKKMLLEKLKAAQTSARSQIEQRWKQMYSEFGKEQMAVVLQNFDTRTGLDAANDLDETEEMERIESAVRRAVQEMNEHQNAAIEEYKKAASARVRKCADEFLDKLKRTPEARAHVEYARDNIGPDGIVCAGMSYQQAKNKLDKAANDAIGQMNLIVAKTDAKTKIDQYVKERETALQQLAKQDIQRRGDYYVEMFKRKMIHKSIGGIIDYESSFDSVKRKIDEAYLEAEQKINAAAGK